MSAFYGASSLVLQSPHPADRGSEDGIVTHADARGLHARATGTYGELGPDVPAFADHLARIVRRRILDAGDEFTPERVEHVLARTHTDDVYLALACARNSDAAWRVFGDRMTPVLIRLARSIAPSEGEAQELASDVQVQLLERVRTGEPGGLAGYRGVSRLTTWIRAVLFRTWTKRLRSRSRRREVSDDTATRSEPAPRGPVPAEADESVARLLAAFERAMQRLTPKERIALYLRYRLNRPQIDIARLLGVSPSRITRLLQRARARLGEGLAPAVAEIDPTFSGEHETWHRLVAAVSTTLDRYGEDGGTGARHVD